MVHACGNAAPGFHPHRAADSCRHGQHSLCAWPFETKTGFARGVKCDLAHLHVCYLSLPACSGLNGACAPRLPFGRCTEVNFMLCKQERPTSDCCAVHPATCASLWVSTGADHAGDEPAVWTMSQSRRTMSQSRLSVSIKGSRESPQPTCCKAHTPTHMPVSALLQCDTYACGSVVA